MALTMMQQTIPRIAFLGRGAYGETGTNGTLPAIERLIELHEQGEVHIGPNILPEVIPDFPPELSERCRALICRPTWGGEITQDLVDRLRVPGRPFVIATLSAGRSHIKVEPEDTTIIDGGDGNTRQTAELTIFLAICLLRRVWLPILNMGFGVYERPESAQTRSLVDLTWTVLGPGKIGTSVLAAASALGVSRLRAYHPDMDEAKVVEIRRKHQHVPDAVLWTHDLGEAVADADVVTIHVPLDESSRGMINQEVLAEMRDSTVLVNVARHELVDQGALVEALAHNRLGGYAADVLPKDAERHGANPHTPDVPLWKQACWSLVSSIGRCTHNGSLFKDASLADSFLPTYSTGEKNVILTPHIAGSTYDAECAVAEKVIADLLVELGIGQP